MFGFIVPDCTSLGFIVNDWTKHLTTSAKPIIIPIPPLTHKGLSMNAKAAKQGNFSFSNAPGLQDNRLELPGFERESHAPKVKRTRTFSKHTRTWQLFENLFLEQKPEAYPISLGPYTKGQVLNLSIGLNTCHVQHMRETGMPESFMLYSAKPMEKAPGEWWVEISTNYTRTGQVKPSRKGKGENWMDGLLQASNAAANAGEPLPKGTDPQEDLLAKYLKENNHD